MRETLIHKSYATAVAWRLPLVLLLSGGAGAWPTMKLWGMRGLVEEALAAAAVLLAMVLLCGAVILAARRGGAKGAALAFIYTGPLAGLLALLTALGLWWASDSQPIVLLLWMAIFFLIGMITQGVTLSSVLRRDAEGVC